MKIGLLSDIHANAHALEAVLKSARKRKVKKLLCCGDYVGYYYEPDRTIALLNDWDWVGISGNHEAMLLDWLNGNNQNYIDDLSGNELIIIVKKIQDN